MFGEQIEGRRENLSQAMNGIYDYADYHSRIYDYADYHSRIHEVLGIARGHARVRFGGAKGRALNLKAGDVVRARTCW